jgi:serine/threonine protein phosphatase PrpC
LNHLGQSTDTYASSNGIDAIFCEFDEQKNVLNFVGAGRPIIIVRKEKNYIEVNNQQVNAIMHKEDYHLFYLRGDFVTLDLESGMGSLNNQEIQLEKEDIVYLFSDGITDQFGGADEKKFSKKKLMEMILANQGRSLKSQKLVLYKELDKWSQNHEQTDDIVFIGIQFS